jgi:hypothetical protein
MLERIAELKAKHPEFEWLMRTDDEQGYMVHLHAGTIQTASGAIAGFERTYVVYGPDLEKVWDEALAKIAN